MFIATIALGACTASIMLCCDMQLVVAMVALKSIVGLVPTLCGLASVVIVAPLGTVLGMLAQRVRKSLIAKTDARVQLITEVLSSKFLQFCHYYSIAVNQAWCLHACSTDMLSRRIRVLVLIHSKKQFSFLHPESKVLIPF